MQKKLSNNYILTILFLSLGLIPSLTFGQVWEGLPFSLNWSPRIFYEDTITDKLYIGGNFTMVDSIPFYGLIEYDGINYTLIDSGQWIPNPPIAITSFQQKLYLGGFGGMGYWDGQDWTFIDSASTTVWILIPIDGKLVVGGLFKEIGGQPFDAIASWDGQYWSDFYGLDTIIGGMSNSVNALVEYQGEIYVGGNFNNLGAIKEIIKWDGITWEDVGGGIKGGGDEWVEDMVVFQGELYVGGRFFENTGGPGNLIARWDGQEWDDVGGGIDGIQIFDMYVFQDELWVVGNFEYAGGIPAQHIAKWDGQNWCSLGSTFDNPIGNISSFKNELYIGGGWWSIDGDSSIAHIAKLANSSFQDSCTSFFSDNAENVFLGEVNIYPNPAENMLNIESEIRLDNISIYNLYSQKVVEIVPSDRNQTVSINVSDFPSGIYLVELVFHKGSKKEKVLIR
jgi:hypothetical protein